MATNLASDYNMAINDIPVIHNPMTGKNRGTMTKWYDSTDIFHLVEIADPGDLLQMDRGGIQHWAVYAGLEKCHNGSQTEPSVVHFGFDTDSPAEEHHKLLKPTINLSRLVQVVGKSKVRINNAHDHRFGHDPASDIAVTNKRIQQFLEENKRYHLFQRNCEGFATYCRYGKQLSEQVGILLCVLCGVCCGVMTDSPYGALIVDVTAMFFMSVLSGMVSTFGIARSGIMCGLTGDTTFRIVLAMAYLGGLSRTNLLVGLIYAPLAGGLQFLAFAIELCYFVFMVKVKNAAYVVGLSYLATICAPTYTVCGVGMPAAVYTVGMNYLVSLDVPARMVICGIRIPAWVYMVVPSYVALVLGLKYVLIGIILPLTGYTLYMYPNYASFDKPVFIACFLGYTVGMLHVIYTLVL